ncbi:MAG: TonB-dependent receptor, partial [Pyrinomonadaceae bacterium]
VDRQFVENIPLNGRSFQSLIALSPGVTIAKPSGTSPGQFSVNGQRTNTNYFIVDGVSANVSVNTGADRSQAGGAFPGLAITGGTNTLVSVDSLQEFKVLTSTYAPEFGRTPGGQISMFTRSGTNEFHGTVFEYFRNDALDATDWFANRLGQQKPPLRQNDFGFVVGGPILLPRFGEGGRQPWFDGKNRTFFFFSYEGLRLLLPQTTITEVPTLTARQNAPTALQPFLNAFPLPNGGNTSNGLARFSASFSDPTTLNATSVRVDHALNDRLTFFGRYNYAPSQSVSRGNTSVLGLSALAERTVNIQTLTAGSTQVFSPTITNEFRANWSRSEGG